MTKSELITIAAQEIIENANLESIKVVFTPDYIAHAENKEYKGLDFIKKYTTLLHKSISGIRISKIEFLAEEKNTICWQRTLQGTHKKDMKRIPASNKKIKWNEIVVSRFEENKIAEEWIVSELMGQLLLKQIKQK